MSEPMDGAQHVAVDGEVFNERRIRGLLARLAALERELGECRRIAGYDNGIALLRERDAALADVREANARAEGWRLAAENDRQQYEWALSEKAKVRAEGYAVGQSDREAEMARLTEQVGRLTMTLAIYRSDAGNEAGLVAAKAEVARLRARIEGFERDGDTRAHDAVLEATAMRDHVEHENTRLRAHQHCATTEPPGAAVRCVLTVLDALHDERTRLRAVLEVALREGFAGLVSVDAETGETRLIVHGDYLAKMKAALGAGRAG